MDYLDIRSLGMKTNITHFIERKEKNNFKNSVNLLRII